MPNILVYSHREDAPNHGAYRKWLEQEINGPRAFGFSDLICSGFLRVVTHPQVFKPPSPVAEAVSFVNQIRGRPNCALIAPGSRHWEIFTNLCKEADVKGNLVADAYFAALAIESGCVWITTDRNYQRFHGLDWKHPLEKKPRF